MIRSRVNFYFAVTLMCLVSCGPHDSSAPRPDSTEKIPKKDILKNRGPRSNSEEKEDPYVFEGHKDQAIMPYILPKALQDEPTTGEPVAPPTRNFELANPYLKIDVGTSRMTFTAILRIKGRADESIKLSCPFNKNDIPWSCDNMFPDDTKIAKQRRLQATMNCLDNYKCSELGFDFYVVINGKKEKQHFESNPVTVRPATSGDLTEDDLDLDIPDGPTPAKKDQGALEQETQKPTVETKPPKDQERLKVEEATQEQTQQEELKTEEPKVNEKIEPEESEQEEPAMTENEIEDHVKKDDGTALEFDGPIETPAPKPDSEYSIPDVETLAPKKLGKNVRNQAHRKHSGGQLFSANHLKNSAGLFIRKRNNVNGVPQRTYGTDIMIELVSAAAAKVDAKFPQRPPMVVGDIAQKNGGRLCRPSGGCHKSHQTGLDADISLPPRTKKQTDLWQATVSKDLDVERFLEFSKALVCAKGDPVIVIFIDRGIKKRACEFAKRIGEDLRNPKNCAYKALRHMRHLGGHGNHMHLRLRCPGNLGCRNTEVTLAKETGC